LTVLEDVDAPADAEVPVRADGALGFGVAVADDCFGAAAEEAEPDRGVEEVLWNDAAGAEPAAAELATAPDFEVGAAAVAVEAADAVLAFFLTSVRESPMEPSAPRTNSQVATEAFLNVSLLKP